MPYPSPPLGKQANASHLVKTLQQAHNPSLNLLLVQSTTGAVKPHSLEGLDTGHDGGDTGSGNGPSRNGGGADGGTGGAEDGGAEHDGRS